MTKLFFQIAIITTILHFTRSSEDRYIRYVKDSCFIKGEALACVKYKALKIAKNTIFGDVKNNETIVANDVISFVPLEENVNEVTLKDDDAIPEGPRGFLSEWSEIAKYFVSLVKEFFKMRGLRINLPPGARTIEEGDSKDDGRGKKKRLAIMIPFLNLLATLKTKMLLIPILLGVMLIKKLLLQHHPSTHYSYFGSDSSDYNSDYANSYAYSSGGGYGKDWASNRAYTAPKHRPTAAPVYITAPGNVA
ncbi:unnamed protein product [Leptidea sinapis]|uniref:Uncharacterized protein n=1 Tax=Leptidea sinapis TaxID=189913 RepID=A0A5E4Q6Q9_9NEOP|nr:unnamed protein product [Leptidea sinapis]